MDQSRPSANISATEAEFDKKRIAHARLKDVFQQLTLVDKPSHREQVTILTGPTGVGKSTAIARLEQFLTEKYGERMREDPGFIPFISVKAAAPSDGNFNWKDAFTRLLEEFNETLIRKKVILRPHVELDGEIINNIRTLVREELRRSVRNCVRHRGTQLLIIDEASHLLLIKSSLNFRHQFELLKSIAIELEIPLILAGAYDLLGMLELNGQLIRRTEVIHFPRYTAKEIMDPQNLNGNSFRNALHTLLEAIPLPKEHGLLNHLDYFYMKSLGCIGILKKWLMKALEMALQTATPSITRAILDVTAKSNKELKKILHETLIGEKALEDIGTTDLSHLLGFEVIPSLNIVTGNVGAQGDDLGVASKGKSKRVGRVGKRGPSRDPVGMPKNAL